MFFDSVRPRQVPILGLGQASLWQGPAGSPFYSTPPVGYYATPSGAPLMTEELTSPEHYLEEYHCYQAPDGRFVSIPFGMADAYKAAGYVAVDYANCGSPPLHAQPVGTPGYVMGQNGGAQGSPQGGGQGGAQGTPSPASPTPGTSFDTGPFFWPGLPIVPPVVYPPLSPPGSSCAWEKDVEGNDVYICRQGGAVVQVPPYSAFGPVSYTVRSFFPVLY